jgi:hypothetical protein
MAGASDEHLRKLVAGKAQPLPRHSSQTKPIRTRTPNAPRVWVELKLSDDAYAMVSQETLSSATPSSLRALGEQLAVQLLAARSQ